MQNLSMSAKIANNTNENTQKLLDKKIHQNAELIRFHVARRACFGRHLNSFCTKAKLSMLRRSLRVFISDIKDHIYCDRALQYHILPVQVDQEVCKVDRMFRRLEQQPLASEDQMSAIMSVFETKYRGDRP